MPGSYLHIRVTYRLNNKNKFAMKRVAYFFCLAILLTACQQSGEYSDSNPISAFSDTEMVQSVEKFKLAQFYLNKANYDSARFFGFQAQILAEETDNDLLKGNITMVLANADYFQSDYEESLVLAEEALKYAEKANSDSLKGFAMKRIANISNQKGDYRKATEQMFAVVELAERINDQNLMGESYQDLANVFDHDAEYEKAKEFYAKSMKIFEELGDQAHVAGLIGNMGSMVYEEGDYKEALRLHKESLQMLIELGHKRYMANTYNNIGVTFRELGEYDSTLVYIQKTMEMDIEAGFKKGIAMNYEMFGEIYLKKEQYGLARQNLLTGVQLAHEIGTLGRQRSMYYRLFRADSSLGNYQQALTWLDKSYALRDSLYNEEKGRAMTEVREEYEAEKREQEIEFLTEKSELENTRNAAIGFSLLSIIGIISLLWMKQRNAQKKEYELLEKDKVITEQHLEASKTETEYLKKELTNYALHLSQKNEFLNQIKGEMAEVRSKVGNQEALKHINQMGSKIYQNVSVAKEKEEFEAHVEHVCEGFFQRLDDKFPGLTRQEKRLAALVRLNLSSKDIANIFSITPKSVDQGRYRLRKKLNLNSNSSLTSYLNVL